MHLKFLFWRKSWYVFLLGSKSKTKTKTYIFAPFNSKNTWSYFSEKPVKVNQL